MKIHPEFCQSRSGLRPLAKVQKAAGGRFYFLCRGFSLVEVLAAIAIIGIITFLAIPNLLRIKEDGERNLATSRAETLNMAMASFLQAGGEVSATAEWNGASDNAARYALLTRYVAFAPENLTNYLPAGYSVTLPTDLIPLKKAILTGFSGTIPY